MQQGRATPLPLLPSVQAGVPTLIVCKPASVAALLERVRTEFPRSLPIDLRECETAADVQKARDQISEALETGTLVFLLGASPYAAALAVLREVLFGELRLARGDKRLVPASTGILAIAIGGRADESLGPLFSIELRAEQLLARSSPSP